MPINEWHRAMITTHVNTYTLPVVAHLTIQERWESSRHKIR